MDLNTVWFILIAVLFAGYFVLEGFDFGVGMLLPFLGRKERDAALKAIGPVWDGNEVWLITAGGALFAAFPEWYATMFSGFYLPLFIILISLILRGVGLEWRGKIHSQAWRDRCDIGIGIGSWVPSLLWGVAFANIVRGVPIDSARQIDTGLGTLAGLLNPFGLLGGTAFILLFFLHGALFLGLKAEEPLRSRAHGMATKALIPAILVGGGFGLWMQLMSGKPGTWAALAVAAVALVAAGANVWKGRDGLAFASTALAVLAVVALFFGSLFPNLMPSTLDAAGTLDIHNAASTHYTLVVMTWAAGLITPLVILYQGWTYWVFRKRVTV